MSEKLEQKDNKAEELSEADGNRSATQFLWSCAYSSLSYTLYK